jgi:aminopeptidase
VRPDAPLEQYARLLVERCVEVRPGWQVIVNAPARATPLVVEVLRIIGRRGAYGLPRLSLPEVGEIWQREAPADLLAKVSPIEAFEHEHADCLILIQAPENTREGSDIPTERVAAIHQARRQLVEPFFADRKIWVGCQFPTPALAQDAGMTLAAFEEFFYGAVLVDWDDVEREMARIAERFDAADKVRVVGTGTDLRFSLAGRHGKISATHGNMPSGEVFYSPVEDSAAGVVEFSEYPACYFGHEADGVRLVFERGRVVESSATSGQEFLHSALAMDEGAAILGEFGIGCNRAIQRHTKNTLFDEKIYGTVHFALGNGFPFIGGTNVSALHWDIVKDLRDGGRIECDGEVVQENGEWRI